MVAKSGSDESSNSRTPGTAVVVDKGTIRISDDVLAGIGTFDDAIAILGAEGIDLRSAEDLGDGFSVIEDKQALIGSPFVILQWRFLLGDFGEFVAAHIMTRDAVDGHNKFVLIDGSTGIREQLRIFQDQTGKNGGLVCKRGLRASDYTFTDEKGNEKPARTYYIDTAA